MKKTLSFSIIIIGVMLSGCLDPRVYTIKDEVVDTLSWFYDPHTYTIKHNIINREESVEAGKYIYFQFKIQSQADVSGYFKTSNESNIITLVLDEASYDDWINNYNSVSPYYDSGVIDKGYVTANLSEGNYYLIYSNKFDTTNKSVYTDVNIRYKIHEAVTHEFSNNMKELVKRFISANYG